MDHIFVNHLPPIPFGSVGSGGKVAKYSQQPTALVLENQKNRVPEVRLDKK